MAAYYNEHDKHAAAWLRELIKAGLIADGEVDERSIEDVKPSELMGYTQCHFFAGIGVWSHALRRAGWQDDRPVWTGSCPCQPFSAAGKGKGITDERHLWPALYHLIRQCKPDIVFGEQVASKDGLGWLDIVQADLEAAQYCVGAVDLCAAGFGAPHIRQRLYWVGHSEGINRGLSARQPGECSSEPVRTGKVGIVADTSSQQEYAAATRGLFPQLGGCGNIDGATLPGPTNGFWGNADWLLCRDGKWRPVEPGTFPLVDGTPARVGRLRGYGNAIVAPVAQAFIEAYLDVTKENR